MTPEQAQQIRNDVRFALRCAAVEYAYAIDADGGNVSHALDRLAAAARDYAERAWTNAD